MNKQEKLTDLFVANKLHMLAQSAQARNLEFNVSFRKLKRVLETKKCYFTGALLDRKDGSDTQLSIDRLDNTKGYIDSNIVACARKFNQNVKQNLSIEDIKILHKGLKKAGLL